LVVSAVQSPNIKPGSTFTVVDYGTADGGTSMPLMYACVKAIREKYGNELPINIIYEDQPINDFKSLFMRLQGKMSYVYHIYLLFSKYFFFELSAQMKCGDMYSYRCMQSFVVLPGLW